MAQDFAGGCVDDADVEVLDEHDHGGSGVGSSYADVVQATVVSQGQFAVGIDDVVADSVVAVVVAVDGGCGFGKGLVGGRWGALVREGSVGPVVVVVVDEDVDEGL